MRRAVVLVSIGCGRGSAPPSPQFELATIPVGAGAASVELADVDRDGRLDLLVANADAGTLTVLLGRARGRFEPAPGSPVPAGQQPNDVALGDVNGDGALDVAIANHDRPELTVLLGDGRGGFRAAPGSPVAVPSKPHVHGVALADFDGDGVLDIATESWSEDRVVWLHGDGRGGFRDPVFVATGSHPYQRLRAADLDGDGHADLITTDLDGDAITWLRGDGRGGFTREDVADGHVPFGVAIGDVDGDGRADLAIVDAPSISAGRTGSDGLVVLAGDGRGGFAAVPGSPAPAGAGPTRVAIARGLVAVAAYKDGAIRIYRVDRAGVHDPDVIATGGHPDGIAIGDLDGDGKLDVVATSELDGVVRVLYAR